MSINGQKLSANALFSRNVSAWPGCVQIYGFSDFPHAFLYDALDQIVEEAHFSLHAYAQACDLVSQGLWKKVKDKRMYDSLYRVQEEIFSIKELSYCKNIPTPILLMICPAIFLEVLIDVTLKKVQESFSLHKIPCFFILIFGPHVVYVKHSFCRKEMLYKSVELADIPIFLYDIIWSYADNSAQKIVQKHARKEKVREIAIWNFAYAGHTPRIFPQRGFCDIMVVVSASSVIGYVCVQLIMEKMLPESITFPSKVDRISDLLLRQAFTYDAQSVHPSGYLPPRLVNSILYDGFELMQLFVAHHQLDCGFMNLHGKGVSCGIFSKDSFYSPHMGVTRWLT